MLGLPLEAFTALVYGVRQLAADALDAPSPTVPSAFETTAWVRAVLEVGR